jgi:hypothetical protein
MIGWFFIPIANFFRPYQAVKETWQASDPRGGDAWRTVTAPALLPLWWALWLGSSALNQATIRMSWRAEEIDEYIRADWVSIAAQSWDIPLTLVALLLVQRLSALQERKHALVASEAPLAISAR